CALKPAGHTRSPGGLQARGAIPELPSDAIRSCATLNRRSDASVAHAVGVQSMSARRGQRRTRTAEYDSFSVADDSARPGAELPVKRRSPLSCSKTFEIRWFLFATRQPVFSGGSGRCPRLEAGRGPLVAGARRGARVLTGVRRSECRP